MSDPSDTPVPPRSVPKASAAPEYSAPGYSVPDYSAPASSASASSGSASSAPLTAEEDKLWASLAHFLNIIPLVPAIIIFVAFGNRGPRTKVESKEALNWTINVSGIFVIAWFVQFILSFIPIVGWVLIGVISILLWALGALNLAFAIVGGLKVNTGGSYRYPVNIRWIK